MGSINGSQGEAHVSLYLCEGLAHCIGVCTNGHLIRSSEQVLLCNFFRAKQGRAREDRERCACV